MAVNSNWVNSKEKENQFTTKDKLRELLRQPYKLVLVQQHELERLRTKCNAEDYTKYIDGLYDHYVVKKLPKTYLCNTHQA